MNQISRPLVSIGIAIWNGELFLAQTLKSLLLQDWKNIEIIILDNQSIDSSVEIVKLFAEQDSRVRLIQDTQQRKVIEAQKYLASLARGEYWMIACDDDVYDITYITSLMNLLLTNEQVGLAYSGHQYIDEKGDITESGVKHFFNSNNSPFYNFYDYLKRRDPMALIFGVVRMKDHQIALPYYRLVNKRFSNHDNLYILKLMSQAKLDSQPLPLFYYRQRDRKLLYEKRGLYKKQHPFVEYWVHITHQYFVTLTIIEIIRGSNFSALQKSLLHIRNIRALLYFCRIRYLINNFKSTYFRKD